MPENVICEVTECEHNEDKKCTASEIKISSKRIEQGWREAEWAETCLTYEYHE